MHQIFNSSPEPQPLKLHARGPGRNSYKQSIILKTLFVIIILNQPFNQYKISHRQIKLFRILCFCRNPSVYQQAVHIPGHPS